jgi:hypothetical protein
LDLDDGLSEVEWLRAMWCETMDKDSTIYNSTIFGNSETAVVISQTPNPEETALVTDARALFDHRMKRSGNAGSQDRRAQTGIVVITHNPQAVHGKLFWVPAEVMVSDTLTTRNGNSALLRKVLFLAVYGVGAEAIQELMKMAEQLREDQAGDKTNKHRNREKMKPGNNSNSRNNYIKSLARV